MRGLKNGPGRHVLLRGVSWGRMDAGPSRDEPCRLCQAPPAFSAFVCKETRANLWFYRVLADKKMQTTNLDWDFPALIGYKILVLLLRSVDESPFQPRRSISTYKHSRRSQDFLPLLQFWPILFLR